MLPDKRTLREKGGEKLKERGSEEKEHGEKWGAEV